MTASPHTISLRLMAAEVRGHIAQFKRHFHNGGVDYYSLVTLDGYPLVLNQDEVAPYLAKARRTSNVTRTDVESSPQ